MMVAKQIKGHYLPIYDNNIDNQSTVLCDNSMENLNKPIINTSYGIFFPWSAYNHVRFICE